MTGTTLFVFGVILSYCIGSFSGAIFITRFLHLPDPRQHGSKNPGATNVLRVAGKSIAVVVLVIDVLKGFAPVFIAQSYGFSAVNQTVFGMCAVIGHMFPVYHGFKGGKGVATALGVFFALNPFLGLFCLLFWLCIALVFRFSSLASLCTIAVTPLLDLFYFNADNLTMVPLFVVTLLVIIKHKENIWRLFNGQESKLFAKKEQAL